MTDLLQSIDWSLAVWLAMSMWANLCCCTSCQLCSDTFNRANSTDVNTGSACGWTEDAGSWEIASNKLKCTSSNARLISTTSNPGGAAIRIVGFVRFEDVGDQARVIFDYQDSSNYFYVQFDLTTSSNVDIQPFRVFGGGHSAVGLTISQTSSVDTDYQFEVCVEADLNYAALRWGLPSGAVDRGGWVLSQPLSGDSGWGLGTGSITSNVQFDSVVVYRTDLASCHCPMSCSSDCQGQMRVDVVAGLDGSGNCCGGLPSTYYLHPHDTGNIPDLSCNVGGETNATHCYWAFSALIALPAPCSETIPVGWTINARPTNLYVVGRHRLTMEGQWEDTTFVRATDCKTMNGRSIPQRVSCPPAGLSVCFDPDAAIEVTSIP